MKILTIIGTRPEAVKMSPVIAQLQRHPDKITSVVCVTAQHREMLDPVLELFQIKPHHDLNIMQSNQRLANLTANLLMQLDRVFLAEKPDWVLVQGDTTTVMAATLAAYYQHIRVGHVEAGLRSHNKLNPFPEEINRKIVGTMCDLHFAPTETARQNLLREGVQAEQIHVTGNSVIDALVEISQRPYTWRDQRLESVVRAGRLILVTAHRRESFGQPLHNICLALKQIATSYPDVRIVYPVHLNPQVQQTVYSLLADVPGIVLLEPVEYQTFVQLMKHAYLILTDSGGLQEEAPALGVPVLVLREVTERPEAVAAGTSRLVGTQTAQIIAAAAELLNDKNAYAKMAQAVNPFGDGHASERIVDILLK